MEGKLGALPSPVSQISLRSFCSEHLRTIRRESVVSGLCRGHQGHPCSPLQGPGCPGRATEGKGFPVPLQVMSPQPTQAGVGEACNLLAAGVCRFQLFLPNETYHALGPLPSPSWEKQNRQTTELGESLAASPAPMCVRTSSIPCPAHATLTPALPLLLLLSAEWLGPWAWCSEPARTCRALAPSSRPRTVAIYS